MRGAGAACVAACIASIASACSYHGRDITSGDAGVPDAMTSREDAPPGTSLWRMDTDVELAAGAQLEGASVLARGVVEPEAFALGVLRVRSSNAEEFTDPTTADWAVLDGLTPVATALSALPLDARARPGGFGLDSDDSWTLWADGEIYLPLGVTAFALIANEHGFVDVDVAGDGAFTRVVASSGAGDTGSVTAPADGWYPVRMGLATDTNDGRFLLELDPVGGSPGQPAFPAWFRTRANTLSGVVFTATDEPFVVRRAAQTLYTGPALDVDWGGGGPDMDLIGTGSFGTRWEGQLLITTAGDYSFHVKSDDGHRLRLDRQLVSDQWTTGTKDLVTGPITLAEGWHDLVLDHCETGGNASLSLAVETGPDPALVGQPIPAARLRPITGPGDRTITAAMLAGLPAPPDLDMDINLYAPPGTAPQFVELAVEVDHPNWDEVHLVLTPPASPQIVVLDDNADTRAGDLFQYATIPAVDSWTTTGRWRMKLTDDTGAKDGEGKGFWITVHYSDGPDTVRRDATWTSGIHDFGRPQEIDNVMWQSFIPAAAATATGVVLQIRTCTAPCDAEPWVDLPSSGSAPGGGPAQYAQVRAELTSDGTDSPWLDWVDVLARDP